MFLVYKFDVDFVTNKVIYHVLDTKDFVIESYSYDEVRSYIDGGVQIYGVDMKVFVKRGSYRKIASIIDFDLVTKGYHLFLVSEDTDNYTFLITIDKYGLLEDLLTIPKKALVRLGEMIKKDMGLNIFSIYKVDYKFINLIDSLEKDNNFYIAKEILVSGTDYRDDRYRFTKKHFYRELYYFSNTSNHKICFSANLPKDKLDYLLSSGFTIKESYSDGRFLFLEFDFHSDCKNKIVEKVGVC